MSSCECTVTLECEEIMPDDGTFVYTIIDSQTAALGSTNSADGNAFVKGTAIEGKVEIPSFIGAYKIIKLKKFATRHCNKITELILPDTLEYLEEASLTAMDSVYFHFYKIYLVRHSLLK